MNYAETDQYSPHIYFRNLEQVYRQAKTEVESHDVRLYGYGKKRKKLRVTGYSQDMDLRIG